MSSAASAATVVAAVAERESMTRGRGGRGRVRAHAAVPRLYLLRYARCARRRQRAAGRRPHSGRPAPGPAGHS